MCWLFRDQMLAKINAGYDEIADLDFPGLPRSLRSRFAEEVPGLVQGQLEK